MAICFSIGSRAYDTQHLGIFSRRTSDYRRVHATLKVIGIGIWFVNANELTRFGLLTAF